MTKNTNEEILVESVDEDKKTTKRKVTVANDKKITKTVDDLSLNERVAIDNLADWNVGFKLSESDKGIVINGGVKNFKRLTLSEVDAQVRMGNVEFCGQDGYGTHAVFRIIDPLVREFVFGEDIDPVQLTEERVRELLAIDTKARFNTMLSDLVVTDSEKRMIVRICERIGVEDVPSFKLNAIEKISGIKFE